MNDLAAVFGFAGLSSNDETRSLDPTLPSGWRSMGFAVQWQTRHLHIQIERHSLVLTLTLELGNAMDVVVYGARHRLDVGVALRIYLPRESGTASLKAAGSCYPVIVTLCISRVSI